jgi:integration host factor subunit alpha
MVSGQLTMGSDPLPMGDAASIDWNRVAPHNSEGVRSMSLTKAQIVENIQNQTGLTKIKATETVENLLEIIKSSLAAGENVLVSGFGKFCVKEKKQRKGRNPATGNEMMLDERRVVTFKCSGKLRDKIN